MTTDRRSMAGYDPIARRRRVRARVHKRALAAPRSSIDTATTVRKGLLEYRSAGPKTVDRLSKATYDPIARRKAAERPAAKIEISNYRPIIKDEPVPKKAAADAPHPAKNPERTRRSTNAFLMRALDALRRPGPPKEARRLHFPVPWPVRNTVWPPIERKRSSRLRIPFLSPALNLGVLLGLGVLAFTVKSAPSPGILYPLARTQEVRVDRQLVLLDDRDKPFARRGGCVDAPVRLEELPKHFIDAVLAMEDRRFYSHFGLDPKGIVRALKRNLEARKIIQGGSTITQQLAKLSYLSRERTLERKIQEAVIVLRLELLLSKDEILERYLSAAYFGQGCHGLRAATRHYFKKPVEALTVSESALLVALLRSPSELTRHRDKAWRRQGLVLNAMVETGRLSADKLASLEPAKFKDKATPVLGAYYADWIARTVELPADGATTPLTVKTGFDPNLQRMAEKAVTDILGKGKSRRGASQAALVAMRPDGRVVAMVGGRDYGKSQFNRAFQALRQPGSSFKTFVYLAALRQGAEPGMLVYDEPIAIGDWNPQNYGHSYRGMVSLEQAFSASINTVAVRLSESVGRDKVIAAARDLGISTKLTSTPSIALGTSEVTLVELTSAYAAISANAFPIRPWGVLALGDKSAATARPPSGAGEWKLMVGGTLRQLLSATVQKGTGRGARLPIQAYGKTGTSQDFRDAWFIGFAGNLVVGVWLGNDDNSSMRRVTGGSLPAMIWRRFMAAARKGDRKFKTRVPKIAAFEAKRRRMPIGSGTALASLLMTPQTEAPYDNYWGWGYWGGGRAMLLGQPPDERSVEPENRYRAPRRPSRRMRRLMDGDGGA